MAPKTQISVGIALMGAAIFFIWFEGTDSGHIQWRSDALTLITGLLIALLGYKLQKQRNVPPQAGSEHPKIKDQMLLKRPWLFVVLSGITVWATPTFLFPDTPIHIRVLVAILAFSLVNIHFFRLRRKWRLQKAPETGSN
jgi:uncharacterized membrane protein